MKKFTQGEVDERFELLRKIHKCKNRGRFIKNSLIDIRGGEGFEIGSNGPELLNHLNPKGEESK